MPAPYIEAEALKIDLHRRLALTETEDELRELQAATEDRYGPLPEPVENLFAIQEAKLKLAPPGADYLVFRAARRRSARCCWARASCARCARELDTAVYTSATPRGFVALR